MLQHDKAILDNQGRVLFSYGPRKLEGGVGNHEVVGCAPDEAQFWGVYRHPYLDLMAEHVLDTHDRDSARMAARLMHQNLRTQVVLGHLVKQAETVYPGAESMALMLTPADFKDHADYTVHAETSEAVAAPPEDGKYTLTRYDHVTFGNLCDIIAPDKSIAAEGIPEYMGEALLKHLNREAEATAHAG